MHHLSRSLRTWVAVAGALAAAAPAQQPKGYLTPASQANLGVEPEVGKGDGADGTQDPKKRPKLPPGVRIGANGWPELDGSVVREPSDPGAAPVRVSDFARPAPLLEAAPARDGDGPAQAEPDGGGAVAADPNPLEQVFAVVGSPVRARALAGVRAEVHTVLLDLRGAVVGEERSSLHAADFGNHQRDRVDLGRGLVYGRTEHAAFAERGDLPWPALDGEAGRYLDIHGLLLRLPWSLADREQFSVMPGERTVDGDRQILVIRAERNGAQGAAGQMGPAERSNVDRFELRCSLDPVVPEELRYTLGATGVQRRVRLLDWRPVPGMGLQIPHRREFLDAQGRPRMVVRIDRLEVGLDLPMAAFRPR